MKKFLCGLLVILSVFGILSAQAMNATVVTVVGKVEKLAGNDWVALKEGDVISQGTLISTGLKSSATIKFDKSVLTLAPLSRLTVSQLAEQEGSRDSSVYLDAGKISANIKSSDDKRVNFTVNSPVATASVRGTAGDVDVLGNIRSTESVWSVQPITANGESSKPVPVSQGMETQVSENGTVASPVSTTLQSGATLFASAEAGSDFVSQGFASSAISNSMDSPSSSSSGVATASLVVEISFE